MGNGEGETGIHPPAIDQDRAGAALPVVAAFFRAGEIELFAQQVEEGSTRIELQRVLPPINFQTNVDHFYSIACRRRRSRLGR